MNYSSNILATSAPVLQCLLKTCKHDNRYDSMQAIFDEYSGESKEMSQKYTAEEAYRIASLENKNCTTKCFFFIVDVYYINHPDEDDAINDEKYIENLVRLGEIMDEIPITHKPILAQSDAEYYSSILKASEVHKVMFSLLIEQLNILKEN